MAQKHQALRGKMKQIESKIASKFNFEDLSTFASPYHTPVMVREVLSLLLPEPPDGVERAKNHLLEPRLILDCTLGGGGHTEALLKFSHPDAKVYSIDRDPEAIAAAQQRLHSYKDRWTPLLGNYHQAKALLEKVGVDKVDALLLDAGTSSHQLDDPSRGFSFGEPGPLDMRMGPDAQRLDEWLSEHTEEEIGQVIADYGEMPKSFRLGRVIKRAFDAGELETTTQLADLILEHAPTIRQGHIHPATLVFQALRIAANDELRGLATLVDSLPELVNPSGRIALISFHSLEDRIVKQHFSTLAASCLCPPSLPICCCNHKPSIKILNKKPMTPLPDEVDFNPRARSAKLRGAVRLNH